VTNGLKQQLARTDLSPDEILKILEERTQVAQHELAQQTDAGADVLGYLAAHGGVATRRAVAANIAAPPHANRLLSSDEDEEVRAELARKIARLMPDLSREEMLHLRDISIELLEKLARDQVPRVRAILADEIKHLTCVPKSVVHILARDVEEIVAAPILEYSPLLSDADLIEIIAGASAEHALSVIARRQPLSHDVSDAIVGTLDIPAMATLLANPRASIREQTLERLVESAEEIEALHRPLTLRADLSARTIRRLASFVGTALLESLCAQRGLDDDTRVTLNRRLRSRLKADKSTAPAVSDAIETIELALRDGTLNEEFVEEAAKTGNKEAVVMALAVLGQVPPQTVQRIIEARSAKAIISLVWRAGLSMRVAFKIQSNVAKLTAREILPARSGKYFPLTEEEMRWQLGYFDVPMPATTETKPSSEI
jgi:uncharacterized protein (DUF2336 family)